MKTRVDTSELEDSLGLFFELKKLYILFNCIFKYICVHIYIHTHTYIIYNFGKKIPSPAGMHGHFGFFFNPENGFRDHLEYSEIYFASKVK